MPERRPLVAGNWKLNGRREANARLLAGIVAGLGEQDAGIDVAVCPPFVYLAESASALQGSPVSLGAQDVSEHEADGAYTGEVSAAMLADIGCRYVIVGHSERRQYHGEGDAQVATKAAAVLAAGLTPIACVGESLAEREAEQTLAVIERQLDALLAHELVGPAGFARLVVAYEPVWAIGTGRTATPGQAQQVHARIRAIVAAHDAKISAGLRILYGGSVNSANAGTLFAMRDIDGGLIGGASLKADDFLGICRAASKA